MQRSVEDLRFPSEVEIDVRALTTPDGRPVTCAVVFIDGEEYKWCEEVGKNKLMNDKKPFSDWGDGVPGATRTGKLGEVAIAKLFGLAVDFGFRAGGDEYDFLICGLETEIKTSKSNLGIGLVRCTGERGEDKPLKDVYIFCYLAGDSLCNGETAVVIVGWIGHEEIIRRFSDSKRPWRLGKWQNIEIPHEHLHPISELLEHYQAGKTLEEAVSDVG